MEEKTGIVYVDIAPGHIASLNETVIGSRVNMCLGGVV